MNANDKHIPVMLSETITFLHIQEKHWYIDATFGRGGHTAAMLEKGANLLALDFDEEAIEYGQKTFAAQIAQGQLILVRANFSQLNEVWSATPECQNQIPSGILFDFGTSSNQLMSKDRGFSFDSDAPLDMRMDKRLGVTAADLLQFLSEKELAKVFIEYGGETYAQPIAKKIKQEAPITNTRQLAQLVSEVKKRQHSALHPATKVFQALRIIVNSELENIQAALPQAFTLLVRGGRLVTLSFHEGEDRIVKHYFTDLKNKGQARLLTVKPYTPLAQETIKNPRSRSTKLRAVQKL